MSKGVAGFANRFLDLDDVSINIKFEWERSPSQIEECHGFHEVGNRLSIDLKKVSIDIGEGQAVDILPLLTEKQKDYLIDRIEI